MAKKFFAVARDISAVRQQEENLHKEFFDSETDRVVMGNGPYYSNALAITKDGRILWGSDDGVIYPSYGTALKTLVKAEERAAAVIKQAEKDLQVCRKIRQALENIPREFGHQTESPGLFSGLLKQRED